MKTKHTELPWLRDEENPMLIYHEGPYKGSNNVRSDILTIIQSDEPQRVCEANAAFVFRACTNYETQEAKIKALLDAAKDFAKEWSHFCKHVDFAHSNLDARAIRFMNEVPGKIAAAIALAKKGK